MIRAKPISDLNDELTKIEKSVHDENPIFLKTKNHGVLVVMTLDSYSHLAGNVETALIEAETEAENNPIRYTRDEMYKMLKDRINAAR